MATKWDSGSKQYSGPTLEDCEKLMHTIQTELLTDGGVRVMWTEYRNPTGLTRLEFFSPGIDPETGGPRDHIWATKELQLGYEAVTYRQLYDLLIVAYRMIEGHLSGQQPML